MDFRTTASTWAAASPAAVYCHINARGDVEPCVFIHYSTANIKEKSLLECLQQPLFQSHRKHWPWNDNMLQPCPMLENPEIPPQIVKEADAHSTEYVTPETADELCARTTPYAHAWRRLLRSCGCRSIRPARRCTWTPCPRSASTPRRRSSPTRTPLPQKRVQ